MKRIIGVALCMAAAFPLLVYAQTEVVVPGYYETGGTEGTLNAAVTDAKNAGTLSTTVFKLKPWERYILIETITIPAGQSLTIVADEPGTTQESAPPQIMWSPSGGIATDYNFDCYGNLTLKNIWVVYATLAGNQTGTSIRFYPPDTVSGINRGTFEGVIFDYSQIGANSSGAICVMSPHFRGYFKNCYFRNCSDPHFRYYGRAVSFPFNYTGYHNDSLTFDNCSFANLGYVIMQELSNYTGYLSMNHCTVINTMMFCLESAWWHWLSITNSLFVNTFMYSDFGFDMPEGGVFGTDSVSTWPFVPPFTDQERHILFMNNAYCIEPWLVDWMAHNPYTDTVTSADRIPKPQPMLNSRTLMFFDTTDDQGNKSYPYMNRANNYDGVEPNFPVPPTNYDRIKWFLYFKWTNNADTNWAYDQGSTLDQKWPLGENMRLPTANTLKTAAMGGFPVGDLYRWDKSRYSLWNAQAAAEEAQIMSWLTNGLTDVAERPGLPARFELGQNYPNPFNPATKIDYSVGQTGPVSLKVFDLLGREVATLFNGEQRIGNFTAEFDGTNLASGVYIYRLQFGTNSISRKLVLMK